MLNVKSYIAFEKRSKRIINYSIINERSVRISTNEKSFQNLNSSCVIIVIIIIIIIQVSIFLDNDCS